MNNIKKTIRLKKDEALLLQEKSFSLAKKAINQGNKVFYRESDIVHYIISQTLEKVDIDNEGYFLCNYFVVYTTNLFKREFYNA